MSKQDGETKDTVWVGPDLGDGERPALRIGPNGQCQAGTLGPPRADADHVLNLRNLGGPFYQVVDEARVTFSGPSQVATDKYRDGWTRIFGGKPSVGSA
jgi:hypothetical protein